MKYVPLRSVARVVNGGTPTPAAENWNGAVPWATPIDLGRVDGQDLVITDRSLTLVGLQRGSGSVPGGSLILSTRAPVGYVARVKRPTAFNQGCKGLMPREDTHARFLQYWLWVRSPDLRTLATGSTFSELSTDSLMSFNVPAIHYKKQRQIAGFLDDQVARVDEVVAMRRHQLVLNSRRHRGALANAAMVLGADEPRTPWMKSKSAWRLLPLKAVAKNLDSRRVPLSSEQRSFRRGDYRYFGASAVVDMIDDFIFDGEYALVGEDGAALENPDSDVVQLVSGRFWLNNHAHILAARQGFDIEYLAHYLRLVDRDFLISGATRPKITQQDLMELLVVVPPLDEQRDLARAARLTREQGESAARLLARGIDLLKERKRALITACVTGEFDVSSASTRAADAVIG